MLTKTEYTATIYVICGSDMLATIEYTATEYTALDGARGLK
jgi:hypothetical protein